MVITTERLQKASADAAIAAWAELDRYESTLVFWLALGRTSSGGYYQQATTDDPSLVRSWHRDKFIKRILQITLNDDDASRFAPVILSLLVLLCVSTATALVVVWCALVMGQTRVKLTQEYRLKQKRRNTRCHMNSK